MDTVRKQTTRTARVDSGITASWQNLVTLFGSSFVGKNASYDDVLLENTGDTDLRVASLTSGVAATDADGKTLAAGDVLFFGTLTLASTWVKTTNASGTNVLEFTGEPAQ